MTPRTPSSARSRGRKSQPHPATAHEQPMSNDQAVYLKALAGQALEPEAFRPGLSEAEAARRIRALEAKLKIMDGPPHTM